MDTCKLCHEGLPPKKTYKIFLLEDKFRVFSQLYTYFDMG